MPKVKCPICKETFDKDEKGTIHIGNRYYHKSCTTEDDIYKDKIFKFLKEVWGEYTYVKINNQIKSHCLTLKCRVKNIYEDLMYFYEIKKNDFQTYKNTIGIVPFIHEEAQKHYRSLLRKETEKIRIAEQLERQINKKTEIIQVSTKAIERKKKFFEIEEG